MSLNSNQKLLLALLVLTVGLSIYEPEDLSVGEVVLVPMAQKTNYKKSTNLVLPADITDLDISLTNQNWSEKKVWKLFTVVEKPKPKKQLTLPISKPPPPAPPVLPFNYVGKVIEDGKTTAFVSSPLQNYALRGGEMLEGVYKVEKVEPKRVVFIYMPLEQEQVMTIGDKD